MKTFRPASTIAGGLQIRPQEPVEVEIVILPSATVFEPGDTLRIVVQGSPISPEGILHRFDRRGNSGNTTLHTGGPYDAQVVLPTISNRV